MSCAIAWTLLTGCTLISPKVEPFFCKTEPAYNQDGTVDTEAYHVKRDCLRGQQQRLEACYSE